MNLIDKAKNYSGGSAALAWLVVLNLAASLTVWILAGLGSVFHWNTGWVYQWFYLSSDFWTFVTHPWTLATYMVTQDGLLHLIFNVLWLYWFGLMLLDYRRGPALIWLYVGGGLAGGVFYLVSAILFGRGGGYLAGSSAAVLSLMTALAIVCPNREVRLWLIGGVKMKWIAIVCIVLTLLGSRGFGAPNQLAHAGGIAFGAAWALGWNKIKRGAEEIKRKAPMHVKKTIKAMETYKADSVRLDELLDKIRVSGYDSLTAKEQKELNDISARMNKNSNE